MFSLCLLLLTVFGCCQCLLKVGLKDCSTSVDWYIIAVFEIYIFVSLFVDGTFELSV